MVLIDLLVWQRVWAFVTLQKQVPDYLEVLCHDMRSKPAVFLRKIAS